MLATFAYSNTSPVPFVVERFIILILLISTNDSKSGLPVVVVILNILCGPAVLDTIVAPDSNPVGVLTAVHRLRLQL